MCGRVAIVGSGVSGLSALWALNREGHEVHIFECNNYIGGHTQSFKWRNKGKEESHTMVDIAFVLLNEKTYPNFHSFLSYLRIPTNPVRTTFGLTRDDGEFEWSSRSFSSFFTQRRNLLSLTMWRMLFDIIRFNLFATDVLDPCNTFKDESIGSYLEKNRYSMAFKNNYLIPLASSIWVNDTSKVPDEMPALMLVRYFWTHHMLNTFDTKLQWLTIKGGCYQYVQKILEDVQTERIHLNTQVEQVRSEGNQVVLDLGNGEKEHFDRVIIATHAPDALRLRGTDASLEETSILQSFRTIAGTVAVHSDVSFMPARRQAWSAWNFIDRAPSQSVSILPTHMAPKRTSLTFYMNDLLNLPHKEPIFTTLNPPHPPAPSALQGMFSYKHPVYDSKTLAQQEKLPSIQGRHNIWYAGAWMRFGFHEHGFTAGLNAAKEIDPKLELPFKIRDWTEERGGSADRVSLTTLLARSTVLLVHRVILAWLWILSSHRRSPGR